MLEEERDLVERCLVRQEAACYEFVERFQTLVYGVCARLLTDRHEAEDMAQEVFMRALRSLKSWDGERPLRPWLIMIATNRCRTWLSQRKRRPSPSEATDDLPDHRAGDDDARELHGEIRAAVASLRPEYQQVFLLFHEQGLNYEQISEATGKPIGTLKTWLHRGRAAILTYLRERGLAPETRHDVSRV